MSEMEILPSIIVIVPWADRFDEAKKWFDSSGPVRHPDCHDYFARLIEIEPIGPPITSREGIISFESAKIYVTFADVRGVESGREPEAKTHGYIYENRSELRVK